MSYNLKTLALCLIMGAPTAASAMSKPPGPVIIDGIDYTLLTSDALYDEANETPMFTLARDIHPVMPVFNKRGYFFGGTPVDDPWYLPNVDVLFDVDAGRDVFLAVDQTAENPGAGEVDGFSGARDLNGPKGDVIILGDADKAYYTSKQAPYDIERDFIYIHDFEISASKIRLHGTPDDYVMINTTAPHKGTAIFRRENSDMIAFVHGYTPTDFDNGLYGHNFDYATTPRIEPAIAGMFQLGEHGAATWPGVITATDPQGNLYTTISINNPSIDDSGDEGSFYLAKYSPSGERLWIKKHGTNVGYGGTEGGEIILAMGYANGSVYVSGVSNGPYGTGPNGEAGIKAKVITGGDSLFGFVAKFSAETGAELNVAQTRPDTGNTLVSQFGFGMDQHGDVYVSGAAGISFGIGCDTNLLGCITNFVTDFAIDGTPPGPLFVMKYDGDDLSVKWQQVIVDGPVIGNLFDPNTYQISNAALGEINYIPAGSEAGAADKNLVSVSGFTLHANFCGASTGNQDIHQVLLDADTGEFQSCDTLGDRNVDDQSWASAKDDKGYIYLSVVTHGELDPNQHSNLGNGDSAIVKYKPGVIEPIWTRYIGSSESDSIRSIKFVDGKLYLSGDTRGNLISANKGGSDIWAMIMDTDGNIDAQVQFGTEKDDFSMSITVADDQVYLGGMTEGSMVAPNPEGNVETFLTLLDKETLSL